MGNVIPSAVSIFLCKLGAGDYRVILVHFKFYQVVERRVRIYLLQEKINAWQLNISCKLQWESIGASAILQCATKTQNFRKFF